jgi:hypothetical protein
VLLIALAVPPAHRPARERADRLVTSWADSLSPFQIGTRVIAVALLGLAVAAGRTGVENELENLAPALVVGAAWPLLVLASAGLGPIWRWTDPWDGLARPIARREQETEAAHVWPAAAVAAAWMWYLSAYREPLNPRSVGALLALYTLFTLAGCLAVGRTRWLASSEPLGILLSWLALLPRGRLPDWQPPRGAEALLGVFAGGILFGAVRRSELWGDLNTVENADLVAVAGVLAFAAAAFGLLMLIAWSGDTAARPAAARAAAPAVAGVIVAVALDRNRLFTSLQLLPELVGDPFGRGWDPFGWADRTLDAAPLGAEGLLWAQLAVLAAGYGIGAVVAARRLDRRARGPIGLGMSLLAGASVLAVASH